MEPDIDDGGYTIEHCTDDITPSAGFVAFARDAVSAEMHRPHPCSPFEMQQRLWIAAQFDNHLRSKAIARVADGGLGLTLVLDGAYRRVIHDAVATLAEWHGDPL